jgi:excisionase family DNA binding protein/PAS domain S-box-containing protein
MMTTGDIAKLLHVSAQTVINWLDQGRIPFERIGSGPRRVSAKNLLAYLEAEGISSQTLDQNIYKQLVLQAESAQEHSKELLVVMDTSLKVITCSQEFASLFGKIVPELTGASIQSMLAPENEQDIPNAIDKSIGGRPLELPVRLRAKSGTKRYSGWLTRFYRQGGVTVGFVFHLVESSAMN